MKNNNGHAPTGNKEHGSEKGDSGNPPMLKLLYRPRAQLDRQSIAIYLGLECGSPKAALDAIAKINDAISFARQFPDSGRHYQVEELAHNDYRYVLAKPYLVFYRYNAETLTVYRIIHERQDIDMYALVDL